MKKISDALEAAGVYLAFAIFSLLPPVAASAVGGWIGRTVGPRLAASRKALVNIRRAFPDHTESGHKAILRDMWDNLGRTIAEYPHLKKIARSRVTLAGGDIIANLPKDKPAIFFAAHQANWEIVPPTLMHHLNRVVHVVYRAPNNPYVTTLLDMCRTQAAPVGTIPKSKKGARDIVRALTEGQVIGILIDQKYNEGIPAPFFGHPAMTSPAFAALAQKFGAPLIPVRVTREPHARFTVTLYPPLPTEGRELQDIIGDAHHMLEDWIRAQPGYWLWLHRRWDSDALKAL